MTPGPVQASSRELLRRARHGDSRALSTLFRRQAADLQRWARGRLPHWARHAADTADLVQDVLFQTVRRIDSFEVRGRGALQAYLRQAVQNRIADELRKVGRRGVSAPIDAERLTDSGPSPHQSTEEVLNESRFWAALRELSEVDRLLVVGRLKLDYTYEQLALVTGRPGPEAARLAVRRAVQRLAEILARG